MTTRQVDLGTTRGMTSQSATVIARTANQFDASVMIYALSKTINAKSVMGLMSLGSGLQNVVRLMADGRDESTAMEAVAKVLAEQLGV